MSQITLLVDQMQLAERNRKPVQQCNMVILHMLHARVPEPIGFAVQAVSEAKARSKVMAASLLHEGLMHQPTFKVSHLCLTA